MPNGLSAQPRVFKERARAWAVPIALVVGLGVPAAAQEAPVREDGEQNPPAYVSAVDGTARIDREGRSETLESGMPVLAGDRIRTDAGRVEITFADGSLIHLDRYADADLASDTIVRLSRGRLLATIVEATSNAPRLAVEAPGAAVRFEQSGVYRLTVGGTDGVEVELSVIRGSAQFSNDEGVVTLNAGEQAVIQDGREPSAPQWFNASSESALERWANERVLQWRAPSTSSSYLPTELVSYGPTFDQYGSWRVDATYGSVWYPSVAVGWRPYYHGKWHHAGRYGWTWLAHDAWGWPTHHYGRWHMSLHGSWFWIPSKRWGPAWVYWATSPGYVGWCPLGWNGYPVVNVFTSYGHHYSHRYRDPWRAWTFVSHDRFGRGQVPHVRADRVHLDRDRPAFVMQHRPPGVAPPRSPYGRYAGGTAPPRRPGMSTMAPRADRTSDAFPGGWTNRNPGTAVPRGSATTQQRPGMSTRPFATTPQPTDDTRSDSPYERARPFMNPRNQAAPWRSPNPPGVRRDDGGSDGLVRPPVGAVPRLAPRSDDRDDRGPEGSGPRGFAAPRRAPDSSPGMSRPPDPSGPRPGMSGPPGGYARPRGGDDGGRGGGQGAGRSYGSTSSGSSSSGSSGGDRGGARGGDGGGSRSSGGGGGAARRR
jgi:uncharacterized membrane protein YgcG